MNIRSMSNLGRDGPEFKWDIHMMSIDEFGMEILQKMDGHKISKAVLNELIV